MWEKNCHMRGYLQFLTDVEITMIRCEFKGCERHMMDVFTQTERSHECKTHIERLLIRCYRLERFVLTNALNISKYNI